MNKIKSRQWLASLLLLGVLGHARAEQADPYLWLEDVTGERALNWVKAQNQLTRAKLDKDAGFVQLRQDLQKILDSKDRIPGIQQMGKLVYNFWTDEQHPRGLWRRTTLEQYRQSEPKWETVLDIDALARTENENWVFKNSNCRDPEYDRCLIELSRGGADAVSLREFDLNSKQFVKDGFSLPEAKMSVEWQDKNHIFVATDFGPDSLTESGYARILKLWQRGTPLKSATTLLEAGKSDMAVAAQSILHDGQRHEILTRQLSFYTSDTFIRENGQLQQLDIPAKSSAGFFKTQLLLNLKQDWQTGEHNYPAGSLLAIDYQAFRQGKRDFTALFTPTDNNSFNSYTVTRNYLLVQSLENVKSRLDEWHFADGKWGSRQVALPTMGSVSVSAMDTENSDDYQLYYSDYLTPSVYVLAHAGNDQRETLKSAPAFFDASPYLTEQRFATSADGTKVPYFMVRRKDLKLDGKNPTLLYGYGGFEISLTPYYSGVTGRAWLEKGGVYVVANIRGGGEYGPRWHDAALKQNRQRAYDDFAAVARDLIASQITSPQHLGAMGGSNGGLLAGVALTQHPELFNAVVSQVPLLDMRRFNQLLAGASWMGEYGNPDVPEEWAYIQRYSPYQNVKAEQNYPNVLFITSTRDDRVHPGHARKMAAKMLAQGHARVWYYENTEGGHGGAANNAQRADMSAITYSFLWNTLKWDNSAYLAH